MQRKLRTTKQVLVGAAFAATAVALTATTAGAQGKCEKPDKLVVAMTDGINHATPFFVANKQKFFKDACLEIVRVVLGSAGAPMQAAIAAGEVDVAMAGSGQFIGSIARGINKGKIIGTNTDSNYMMLAKKGITSPSELKGKVYGISGYNSGDHLWSQAVTSHFGVKPEEVTWQPIGNPATRLAALLNGSVDAIQMNGASAPPEADEYVIVSMEESPVRWLANGIFARQEVIDNRRDVLVRFLAAVGKGSDYARAHPDAAQAGCLASGSTDKVCKNVVKFALESKNPYNWSSTHRVPRESVEAMLKATAPVIPEVAGLKAEDVADFTIAGPGT